MAQGDRTKEIWLIPKRGSLHQTICFIGGLIDRNYDGKTWNASKQDNIGNSLSKYGATKSGKNISPQSVRTLLASIPQYLGFAYIDTLTRPNTIKITEAGYKLWEEHENDVVISKNLGELRDNGSLIETSNIVLEQFEKLQITNPIILKDCENILVFPFRFMIKLLLELGYLDREEIAYFLFNTKDETEIELKKIEIQNFRKLEFRDRKILIDTFKSTHVGNITLVQASSASYFEQLCLSTGIINRERSQIENPNNGGHSINTISINEKFVEYAENMINKKYLGADTYDFKDNLKLWIEYIGKPERIIPPKDIIIKNNGNIDLLVCVKKNGVLLDGDLINSKSYIKYPMFINEEYEIEFIDPEDGNVILNQVIKTSIDKDTFEFEVKDTGIVNEFCIDSLAEEIVEHSESRFFNRKMYDYLVILRNIDGKDRTDNKNLRGAHYEHLFYRFLKELEKEGKIDDVYWNGTIREYGLPRPAPGGKTGTPDIVFVIDDIHFVLEVTVIKPKSTQFQAEGSSVPDHIRLYKNDNPKNKVFGIFCAPQIHERNDNVMKAAVEHDGVKLKSLTDINLLEILRLSREDIISKLI